MYATSTGFVFCRYGLPQYWTSPLKYDFHIFGGKWRNFVCTWAAFAFGCERVFPLCASLAFALFPHTRIYQHHQQYQIVPHCHQQQQHLKPHSTSNDSTKNGGSKAWNGVVAAQAQGVLL